MTDPVTILLLVGVLGLLLAILVFLIVLAKKQSQNQSLLDTSPLLTQVELVKAGQERAQREVREEFAKNREESASQARALREETGATLKGTNDTLVRTLGEMGAAQDKRQEVFAKQLGALSTAAEERMGALRSEVAQKLDQVQQDNSTHARGLREEVGTEIKGVTENLVQTLGSMAQSQHDRLEGFSKQTANLVESNERKMGELRASVEQKLTQIQADNAARLEEMRRTVDEKLHGTLEKRLGESFSLVNERLEQVYKGLGEMQTLASGVGDLKKVLTNVKVRGTWGEMQLANLLEQILSPDQYAANVATKEGSAERVEFAIRLPGRDDMEGKEVWLPIDAKFPKEDYERLVEASENADAEAVAAASRQLEASVKSAAKDIHDKYLNPPRTTDFGIMFLPSEGLYAEVLRRPGLVTTLQSEHRVNVTGPTTLGALLNSLQMGFRTLAIQQRSSEVWTILGAVKTEFGKFGDILDKVKKKIDEASNTIDTAAVRTRVIQRKLRSVEELPTADARALLGEPEVLPDDGEDKAM